MHRMGNAAVLSRSICAALLALMLALRVLGSTGLMPGIDHGRLTIIACPDAGDDAPLTLGAHHHQQHHGKAGHAHQPCPYAAASWLSLIANDFPAVFALLAGAFAALMIAAHIPPSRGRRFLRPYLRGPPLPA